MRGIARACADDSTGDPGGFREGVCVCGGGGGFRGKRGVGGWRMGDGLARLMSRGGSVRA